MSKSSLKLFSLVPEGAKKSPVLIPEYGIIVSPEAVHDLKNIKTWLKETGVGDAERNSSFWGSWAEISRMSDFQMRLEQLLNYFTRYGLEYFGIDSVREGYVYIPAKEFHTPTEIRLKIIYAAPIHVLIDRCFSLLNSGMALSQETIGDIITVLNECHYVVTGEEEIKNKEAEILFIEATGKLPVESSKLFRYLIYDFTGQSMIVNDEKTKDVISSAYHVLPYLDEKRMVSLAQSFNRYKDLWMAIKKSHPKNRTIVNRLTKLSKIHHKPLPENVMNNLTSKKYDLDSISKAAKKATVFQLVRAINAIRLRQEKPEGSVFRIRNSRIWTSLFSPNLSKTGQLGMDVLINELRSRFANVVAYTDKFVDFAFPTSEKNFVGNVPEGSFLRFEKTEELLLVGVHWTNPDTDLDLRAESAGFSVGWNTNFRTTNRGLMHSGDMTSAPKPYGASEWLYCKDLGGNYYNISLNVFRAGRGFNNKFKFIIGHSSNSPERNYQIAPDNVLISYEVPTEDRQTYLGTLYDDKKFVYMILGTGATGKGRVGRWSKFDAVQQDVSKKKVQSALRLSDVVRFTTDPEKATIDLSLGALTKDSFLNLLK